MTNTQSKMPQLRFSEFSDSWETKTIKDIAKIERGRFSPRPRNNPKYYGGDIPFVQTSDVTTSNGIVTSYSQTLNELGLKVSKKFPKGTVLITIAANIGYCGVLQEAMACPDSLIGINCYDLDENEFLCILLNKLQPRIDYLAPQAAQKNINIEFLNPYRVKVPETPEKKKIASFLSTVDKKVSLLKQKHEQLVQYKNGIMQQLFSQQLRFEDDNGQAFPDWEVTTISSFMMESRVKGSTGDIAKKITVKLWGKGVFEKTRKDDGSVNTQYYTRKSGQFLYSKLDFLNCAFGIVPEELNGFESTVDLPCFDMSDEINKTFILEYIKQKRFYKKYGDMADGSRKAKRIHADTFLSFPINLPSENEQNKIADFLESIDQKISLAQQQIEQTQAYKQGLLQQMFV